MYQQLKRVSMALALGSVCFGAFAQQKTIKGTVKDSNGEPMIGVSVFPEGMAGLGSVTDLDGTFPLTELIHLQFSNLPISVTRKRR